MNINKLIFTLFFAFTSHTLLAQILINEFLASNSSTITDTLFDETADWIELYNTGNNDFDLSGYFLTDNLNKPDKWQFPQLSIIKANSFLLIWADGEDTGLHTSFKISADGEELGLFNPDLQMIDTLSFGAQETDVSFGRFEDASESWYYFQKPSPAHSNNNSTPYDGITYYVPLFSLNSGFYSSEQSLEITSLGGQIHYTIDGSTPTIDDDIFTEEISFNENTFIRARVIEPQKIPGPVVTQSYFFESSFENRQLPVVSLVTDEAYFWSEDSGIYVQDFKPEWEYPLNIEFFENDGNNRAVFNKMAGVKINGQQSWQLPQKMLGIYFKKKYGKKNLDYPVFDDRDRSTYNEIVLRAGGSDWSQTLIRDGLGQELCQEYTPIAHQGFRPGIVFINGEYLGIHNIRSRIDEGFIESNYHMESGTYDLIENEGNVEEGSVDHYLQLNQILNSDLSNQNNFDQLSSILDLNNFTDYWISEIWEANSSWGHNLVYWKPKDGGKWQFIFDDMDRSFMIHDFSIKEYCEPLGNHYYDYARTWLQHIFQNTDYRNQFIKQFNNHIYTTFNPKRLSQKVDEFSHRIQAEIPYHVDKWSGSTSAYGDGIESVEFWEEEILKIKSFAEARQLSMMEDLKDYFNLGDFSYLQTKITPANAGNIYLNDFLIPADTCDGPYFENQQIQLTAIPKPGFSFNAWYASFDEELITLEEDWKYNDQGMNLGSSWKETDYDDSSWSVGQAELGYGDGDENTVVEFGDDIYNRHITTYFRKHFSCNKPNTPLRTILKVRRDDGAVVYLNGVEVARLNMPDGEIDYLTRAPGNISAGDEDKLNEFVLNNIALNENNVMAVEIHQYRPTSIDISFDLYFAIQDTNEAFYSSEESIDFNLLTNASYTASFESNGACVLPEIISENTTLNIDCSPYLANEEINILPNVTLTIDPGVEIWFSENSKMIVQGNLLINGTEDQNVIFKANSENGNDQWGNLEFNHSTDTNVLNYLKIQDATKGIHPVHQNAAISILFSEVQMNHIHLEDNYGNPIFALYSDITLENSQIHSAITGDLINVKYGSCLIDQCTFTGNNQIDTDAIDLDGVTNGIVKNSIIRNFFGSNSDGIDLGEQSKNIQIEKCAINNIKDKGISIGQSSTAIIKNNTISYCNAGVGIKDLGEAEINHNTFYGNVYAVAAFEKNLGAGGGKVNIKNSILSNSGKDALNYDQLSEAIAYYNLYDTDTLIGENNLFANPYFKNPNFSNFELLTASPAIHSAEDGDDLGALYMQEISNPKLIISDILYFHPLDERKEFIKIYNPGAEAVDMSFYSISNGVKFVFPEGSIINSKEKILIAQDKLLYNDYDGQVFQWTSGKLSNDGEKIELTDNYGIVIDYLKYQPHLPWPELIEDGDYISLISDSLDNHFGENWIIKNTTAIHEISTEINQIKIYPNPAKEWINIESSEEIREIEILDISGREVFNMQGSSKKVLISLNHLESGIYIVKVNNEFREKILVE